MLIHALPLDAAMWQPQMEGLSPHSRVIAPDLAGFGGSDPLEDTGDAVIERWADDVIGLLSSLGVDHATVVGASIGADVALAVTRRARDLVGGLGLAALRRPVDPDEERQRLEAAE